MNLTTGSYIDVYIICKMHNSLGIGQIWTKTYLYKLFQGNIKEH